MQIHLKPLSPVQERLLLWIYATNTVAVTAPVPANMEYLRVPHATWQTWSRIHHWGKYVERDPKNSLRAVLTRSGEEKVAEILIRDMAERNGQL